MDVRQRALGLDYPEPNSAKNYPGRNSRQRLLIKDLDTLISGLVNEPVVGNSGQAHGNCRISLAGNDAERRYMVHVDPETYWAGIVYLTLPEHCRGGTEFFRHVALGTDRAPLHPEEFAELGVDNYHQAADKIIRPDSNDPTKWRHLMTVPMRFNRLILLRPWLWHTSGESFGETPENGRLVQLFFFDAAARDPVVGGSAPARKPLPKPARKPLRKPPCKPVVPSGNLG